MPVHTEITFHRPSEARFRELDYLITGEAFSIHNKFGKLHNESVYQKSLYQRSIQQGFLAHRELEVKLTHESFFKIYYVDLCLNGEVVYELKSTESINKAHESQLLNYLFLTNLPFGKIINFRAQSVESRFVSTTLTQSSRKDFEINKSQWRKITNHCPNILPRLDSILKDWGTHLELAAYKQAMIHFLGLEPENIKIFDGDFCIGTHDELLLDEQTALHFSSITGNNRHYQKHLQRLLKNTQLKNIQWINFAGRRIDLISIKN